MKEGFIVWIKQQNRKKTKAGGDESARSNKRGRQEVQWGKCKEVIWGLNIPAGVKDTGPTVDFGKKSHVVKSNIEISWPVLLCLPQT